MNFKLCNIIYSQKIVPGGTSLWSYDKTMLFFIEALTPIDIEWRKNRKVIPAGSFIIGSNVRIFNTTLEMMKIRGMIFKGNEVAPLKDFSVILPEHHLDTLPVIEFFQKETFTEVDLLNLSNNFIDLFTFLRKQDHTCVKSANLMGQIDTRLLRINRYIRKNYSSQITLQTLADLIDCSPVYLSKLYSAVFNISPMKFLQQTRMRKAGDYLLTTDLSISDLAQQLGYISSSQFINLFKRYYGMTPFQFKIKQKKDSAETILKSL